MAEPHEADGAAAVGPAGVYPPEARVICVGDIHGNIEPLRRLWARLASELGQAELEAATVVFLGDLCDRGPATKAVLDFLIGLEGSRRPGSTVFLMGNHDFGMAAFLGCLPADVVPEDLDATRMPEFLSGFWKFPVEGGMHYMGRRWGGSHIYQAYSTFQSYDVQWDAGSSEQLQSLVAAVPEEHKAFLRSLRWVHEQEVPWPPGRVICVHAGLNPHLPLAAQLEALHARDLTATVLHDKQDAGRLAAFSGRGEVLPLHPELEGRGLLVSGHHGESLLRRGRAIIDASGGTVLPGRPLQALVLPEWRLVEVER